MDSEGGVHFERQGLLAPPSLIRVKATALLCSLNILALPAQDEPTSTNVHFWSRLPSKASTAASVFLRLRAERGAPLQG
jgi:hypothetical protein